MKEQKKVYITAAALILIATITICCRIKYQFYTALEPGESMWKLTYEIQVPKAIKGTKINIAFPHNTQNMKIMEEKFFRPNWIIDIITHSYTKSREAVGVILQGSQDSVFIAEFNILMNARNEKLLKKEQLSVEKRAQYLKSEEKIATDDNVVQTLVTSLKEKNNDVLLTQHIFEYCSKHIKKSNDEFRDSSIGVLVSNKGNRLGITRAMIALCRANHVPARMVTGFIVEKKHSPSLHTWLEVYEEGKWKPYDPWFRYEKETPYNYLPVCFNDPEIIKIRKSSIYTIKFHLESQSNFYYLSRNNDQILDIFDLTRFDLSIQKVIAILLLLPLSALITIFFRNVIGLKTFGTFSPCLLAISFVFADWHTGVVALGIIIVVGFITRILLNNLKLLVIARMGILVTTVVICMVFSVSLLHYLQLTPGVTTVLLPIVVLTMIIEQFHLKWEEDGYRHVQKLLIHTLIVSICCYLVIAEPHLKRWALMFPEGQLYVIALMLLIGRYAGYRLTELLRFREFIDKKE